MVVPRVVVPPLRRGGPVVVPRMVVPRVVVPRVVVSPPRSRGPPTFAALTP